MANALMRTGFGVSEYHTRKHRNKDHVSPAVHLTAVSRNSNANPRPLVYYPGPRHYACGDAWRLHNTHPTVLDSQPGRALSRSRGCNWQAAFALPRVRRRETHCLHKECSGVYSLREEIDRSKWAVLGRWMSLGPALLRWVQLDLTAQRTWPFLRTALQIRYSLTP